MPGEAQLTDVLVVDLIERAVALLGVRTPDAHPVVGFFIGGNESFCIDRCGRSGSGGADAAQKTERQRARNGRSPQSPGG
jgi:hypothetical protein